MATTTNGISTELEAKNKIGSTSSVTYDKVIIKNRVIAIGGTVLNANSYDASLGIKYSDVSSGGAPVLTWHMSEDLAIPYTLYSSSQPSGNYRNDATFTTFDANRYALYEPWTWLQLRLFYEYDVYPYGDNTIQYTPSFNSGGRASLSYISNGYVDRDTFALFFPYYMPLIMPDDAGGSSAIYALFDYNNIICTDYKDCIWCDESGGGITHTGITPVEVIMKQGQLLNFVFQTDYHYHVGDIFLLIFISGPNMSNNTYFININGWTYNAGTGIGNDRIYIGFSEEDWNYGDPSYDALIWSSVVEDLYVAIFQVDFIFNNYLNDYCDYLRFTRIYYCNNGGWIYNYVHEPPIFGAYITAISFNNTSYDGNISETEVISLAYEYPDFLSYYNPLTNSNGMPLDTVTMYRAGMLYNWGGDDEFYMFNIYRNGGYLATVFKQRLDIAYGTTNFDNYNVDFCIPNLQDPTIKIVVSDEESIIPAELDNYEIYIYYLRSPVCINYNLLGDSDAADLSMFAYEKFLKNTTIIDPKIFENTIRTELNNIHFDLANNVPYLIFYFDTYINFDSVMIPWLILGHGWDTGTFAILDYCIDFLNGWFGLPEWMFFYNDMQKHNNQITVNEYPRAINIVLYLTEFLLSYYAAIGTLTEYYIYYKTYLYHYEIV